MNPVAGWTGRRKANMTSTLTLPALLPQQVHGLINTGRSHHEAAARGGDEAIIRRHRTITREALIGAAGILIGAGVADSLSDGLQLIEQATGLTAPMPNR